MRDMRSFIHTSASPYSLAWWVGAGGWVRARARVRACVCVCVAHARQLPVLMASAQQRPPAAWLLSRPADQPASLPPPRLPFAPPPIHTHTHTYTHIHTHTRVRATAHLFHDHGAGGAVGLREHRLVHAAKAARAQQLAQLQVTLRAHAHVWGVWEGARRVV
jgi:hypothetical protein